MHSSGQTFSEKNVAIAILLCCILAKCADVLGSPAWNCMWTIDGSTGIILDVCRVEYSRSHRYALGVQSKKSMKKGECGIT